VPVRDVQNFRNTLRDLGKRADVYIYPGMRHAFARPGQPGFSDPEAREAWGQTVEFLAAELKSAN
jgi:carboxymethylenebutenolidase